MTTLHRVTDLTKKIFLVLGVGGVSIFLILTLISYIQSLIPKKVPPPTVTFGQLPRIPFPTSTIANNYTYSINTLSGQLPTLPDRVNVYKIFHPGISLLSLQQAKDLIGRNNIPGEPIQLTSTLYQWQQAAPPLAKISYDIVTNNFTFGTNYLSDPAVVIAPNLPDEPGAIGSARNFFSNFSSDFSDIDMQKTQSKRLSISNGALVPATSIINTQAIRVDFYQNDIDKIPVYYPHYPQSIIYAVVAAVNYPNLVAEGEYYHQPLIPDQSGTYPILTADEAYAELTANKGFIANYDGAKNTILISNAYLAYFATDTVQDYIMPVIVFQGNDNFFAYISAIKDTWISK